jgi:hypothetical protein
VRLPVATRAQLGGLAGFVRLVADRGDAARPRPNKCSVTVRAAATLSIAT